VTGFRQTSPARLRIIDDLQKYHPVNETNISKAGFNKRFRLSKAADFERVFRQNQRSVDDLFTVLYRRNGLGYPRLGLAIAKRQLLSDLDIVIMARRKASLAENAAVFASLARHWQTLSRSKDH
jgi:ribonuclease P protein component